ncbi:MAG: shikimate kinase [Candidatus Poribacteria bacterium]|nr:MAG: shikimate kinase [Candidatus Poribacteria bacterium]
MRDGRPLTGQNIVLVGFMGSGKTSVGRELARRLGWEFVDTDALIERMAGRSIPEIFRERGEPYFRDLESEAIRTATCGTRTVLATGGGAVLRPENMSRLKAAGLVVLLDAEAEELYRRVVNEGRRPLLEVADPLARIRELLEYRRPYYAQADLRIDTTGRPVEAIVEEILKAWKRYVQGHHYL